MGDWGREDRGRRLNCGVGGVIELQGGGGVNCRRGGHGGRGGGGLNCRKGVLVGGVRKAA